MSGTLSCMTGERRRELDGVRGLAIVLVIFGHAGSNHWVGPFAAAGVTLFFTLSGHLITGVLLTEHRNHGRLRLRSFYARRLTRLAPPLFVMLAVTGAVMAPGFGAWMSAATWTTNYASILGVHVVPYGHTWSLAVEEQFYLVWPVVLLALLRSRRAVTATVLLLAVMMTWRLDQYAQGGLLYAYSALETAGSAIVAGCLVAMLRVKPSRRAGVAGVVALLGLALASTLTGGGWWLVLPLFATPAAAVVVAHAGALRWLTWRPLAFCGVVSYSVYLWHEPVSYFLGGDLTPVGVMAGAAAGLVAYFLVEAPVMRLRHPAPVTQTRPGAVSATPTS